MACPHPFLVDQRAYLPRPTSASSNRSDSSFTSNSTEAEAGTSRARARAHATAYHALTRASSPTLNEDEAHRTRAAEVCEHFMSTTTNAAAMFGSVSPRSSHDGANSRSKSNEAGTKKERRRGMMGNLF